ncbi:MAG: hypothetical protein SFV51_20110 [Bryobacteraceae bacterium]|nr:hypothetical protein [Bryobacteraceae bacterium]
MANRNADVLWNRRALLAAAGIASVQHVVQQAAGQTVSPTPTPRDWTGQQPGNQWAEGPAWNGVGRYLVWSDIPNNIQSRWIEDDARVSAFRNPTGYSNGNTFDYEGRQLSCEHGGRDIKVWDNDGRAVRNGKRLIQLDIPGTNTPTGRRNRLFMTASQSLYAVYVQSAGAHIA